MTQFFRKFLVWNVWLKRHRMYIRHTIVKIKQVESKTEEELVFLICRQWVNTFSERENHSFPHSVTIRYAHEKHENLKRVSSKSVSSTIISRVYEWMGDATDFHNLFNDTSKKRQEKNVSGWISVFFVYCYKGTLCKRWLCCLNNVNTPHSSPVVEYVRIHRVCFIYGVLIWF